MSAPPLAVRRLVKELHSLTIDPPPNVYAFAKEGQADLNAAKGQPQSVFINGAYAVEAQIQGPENSPYADGTFTLICTVPDVYPHQPPLVKFVTPIYHPNIDSNGRICLEILKTGRESGWKPGYNLRSVFLSIVELLREPNPDDPLVAAIANEFKLNRPLFERKAKDYTAQHASSTFIQNQIDLNTTAHPKRNVSSNPSVSEERSSDPPNKKIKIEDNPNSNATFESVDANFTNASALHSEELLNSHDTKIKPLAAKKGKGLSGLGFGFNKLGKSGVGIGLGRKPKSDHRTLSSATGISHSVQPQAPIKNRNNGEEETMDTEDSLESIGLHSGIQNPPRKTSESLPVPHGSNGETNKMLTPKDSHSSSVSSLSDQVPALDIPSTADRASESIHQRKVQTPLEGRNHTQSAPSVVSATSTQNISPDSYPTTSHYFNNPSTKSIPTIKPPNSGSSETTPSLPPSSTSITTETDQPTKPKLTQSASSTPLGFGLGLKKSRAGVRRGLGLSGLGIGLQGKAKVKGKGSGGLAALGAKSK
ncbi:ubiquitin-conjugating enzyme/RWD-like protein [Paraphysoderma sedebokerense]|nr:ubiquitin-conjugating enzyme/RWD-like protein [Paraphysoderma sedebokerense]